MITGIDPKVDYVFKRLFAVDANRPLLVHLINSVLHLPPGEQVVDLQIKNPFIEKERYDDKQAIVDVRAIDQRGRQFHVEMQLLSAQAFPQRVLFYWASLYREPLSGGDSYTLLRPTISICLIDFTLFPQTTDYHLTFHLLEPKHSLEFTDHLQIHVLEFPKFTAAVESIADPMDAWCYFFRYADSLDNEHLPVQLQGIPPIQQAMEELTVISQDAAARAIYEDRLKKLRDDRMILEEAETARAERDAAHVERDAARAQRDAAQAQRDAAQAQRDAAQAQRDAAQAQIGAAQAQIGAAQAEARTALEGRRKGLASQIQFCQKVCGQPITIMQELQSQTVDQLETLASQWQQRVLDANKRN